VTRPATQLVLRRAILLVLVAVYTTIGTNLLYFAGGLGSSSSVVTTGDANESEDGIESTLVASSSCGLVNCCSGDVCAGCCCSSRLRASALFGRDLESSRPVPESRSSSPQRGESSERDYLIASIDCGTGGQQNSLGVSAFDLFALAGGSFEPIAMRASVSARHLDEDRLSGLRPAPPAPIPIC